MEWNDVTAYFVTFYQRAGRLAGSLEAKDWMTFALALYGAALGTFNYRQAKRKDRRSVRIAMALEIPMMQGGPGTPVMIFDIINDAHRPVDIRSFALRLGDRRTVVLTSLGGSTKLPCQLADGEAARIVGSHHELADILTTIGLRGSIKLTPSATDATGKLYLGKRFAFDPRQWVRDV